MVSSATAFAAKPFCVSHRAKGFGETENSMGALIAAARAGAVAVEYDLNHTSDHKTVVYHDSVVKRFLKGSSCPFGKSVHELTLEEISSKCVLDNGEKVPTFDEALKVMSGYDTIQFVELKDTITEEDFATIKRYYEDKPEKLMIISFDTRALDLVIKKRKSDDFFKQIKTVRLKKYNYFGKLDKYEGLDAKYIHKAKVKRLQKKGMLVGVYTKDSKRKMKKYLRKGVDFITTNNTKLCEEVVQNYR